MGLQCSGAMQEGESSLFLRGRMPDYLVMEGWCLPHRADGQVTTMSNNSTRKKSSWVYTCVYKERRCTTEVLGKRPVYPYVSAESQSSMYLTVWEHLRQENRDLGYIYIESTRGSFSASVRLRRKETISCEAFYFSLWVFFS